MIKEKLNSKALRLKGFYDVTTTTTKKTVSCCQCHKTFFPLIAGVQLNKLECLFWSFPHTSLIFEGNVTVGGYWFTLQVRFHPWSQILD